MKKDITRVLVTGSNGTVGRHVVSGLREKGYMVIGTDLRFPESAGLGLDKFEAFYAGDITDRKFLWKCIDTERPEAVIHTAAMIDISLPRKKLMKVNLAATRKLYEMFRVVNGKVFVFLSSGSIYGVEDGVLTEDSVIDPGSAYEESKVEAERYLDDCALAFGDSGPELAAVRPSLIYGEANRFLAANYMGIAIMLGEALPYLLPCFSNGPRTNLVHAADVAGAAIFLMEHPETRKPGVVEKYNIADCSPLGFGDHLAAIQRACGYANTGINIPLPSAKFIRLFERVYESKEFLNAFNRVAGVAWKMIVGKHGLDPAFVPSISGDMTSFFGKDTIFSPAKILRAGYKTKHPEFAEGIANVIPWYKENHWIP